MPPSASSWISTTKRIRMHRISAVSVFSRRDIQTDMIFKRMLFLGLVVGIFACPRAVLAQGNYEIQVYPYETVQSGHTMVELHNNFTFEGSKSTADGTYPTNHQLHETIEITRGFTDWFETGFYI